MTPNKLMLLTVCPALVCLALAGCTPSAATSPPTASPTSSASPTTAAPTVSATPTVTATPTPTLDADQAAALDVVERYSAAMAKVRANPAKYDQYKIIDLLKPLAFDDMIQANLNGMVPWRDNGWHAEGSVATVTSLPSEATEISNGTTRVTVTVCRDQRGLQVLDRKGRPVTAKAAQFPSFLENTYDVRRPAGQESFRLWELGGEAVERCEP